MQTTTITDVRTVGVTVTDQDDAIAFYVDTLGFEKRLDAPISPTMRWIEVAPPGATTSIALNANDGDSTGRRGGHRHPVHGARRRRRARRDARTRRHRRRPVALGRRARRCTPSTTPTATGSTSSRSIDDGSQLATRSVAGALQRDAVAGVVAAAVVFDERVPRSRDPGADLGEVADRRANGRLGHRSDRGLPIFEVPIAGTRGVRAHHVFRWLAAVTAVDVQVKSPVDVGGGARKVRSVVDGQRRAVEGGAGQAYPTVVGPELLVAPLVRRRDAPEALGSLLAVSLAEGVPETLAPGPPLSFDPGSPDSAFATARPPPTSASATTPPTSTRVRLVPDRFGSSPPIGGVGVRPRAASRRTRAAAGDRLGWSLAPVVAPVAGEAATAAFSAMAGGTVGGVAGNTTCSTGVAGGAATCAAPAAASGATAGGAGCSAGAGSSGSSSVAPPTVPLASQAAPSATACLGWASTATGRPSSAPTSWATIGIRDEPPTSSTECSCSALDAGRAQRPPQRLDRVVAAPAGPSPPARPGSAGPRWRRWAAAPGWTRRCRPTAPPWPPRTPRAAGPPPRSRSGRPRRARPACRRAPGRRGRTRPRRSRCRPGARCPPAGRGSRSRSRSCAAPPRRTCRRPGRRRRPSAPGSIALLLRVEDRGRLRLGGERDRVLAGRPAGRPGGAGRSCTGPSWPGARRMIAVGAPPSRVATSSTTVQRSSRRHQRLGRVRHAAEQDRRGVAEPALELAGHPVRLGQRRAGWPARRSGTSRPRAAAPPRERPPPGCPARRSPRDPRARSRRR